MSQFDKHNQDGSLDRDPSHYTEDEIIKINERVQIEAGYHGELTNTLCWLCEHCLAHKGNPCSKTNRGTAVKGWNAKETNPDEGINSWQVIDCPHFKFNLGMKWSIPTVTPILQRWCLTKLGNELYDTAIQRDPMRWVDDYNRRVPERCRIKVYLDEYDEYDDIVDEVIQAKADALKAEGYKFLEDTRGGRNGQERQ